MKNKFISLLLVTAIGSELVAKDLILEQSSTTSASKWKDPSSGMTYNNFGAVSFKFKKNMTSMPPLAKLRAPSINAGCGGVSLDAGFAGFLDLKTIGDELNQAISSVGMGVIVVLLQTMPSIGKAFENVQKLIRKIQSMLQNSCQLTVSALNQNKTIHNAHKAVEDTLHTEEGANWFNNSMKGALDKVDEIDKSLKCSPNDTNCQKFDLDVLFKGSGASGDGKNKKSPSTTVFRAQSNTMAKAIASTLGVGDLGKVKVDTIANIYNNKYSGRTLNLSSEDIQKMQMTVALFGTLSVREKDSLLNGIYLDSSLKPISKEIAKMIAGKKAGISNTIKFTKSVNSLDEIFKFLSGDGATALNPNSISVPMDYKVLSVVFPDNSKKENGGEGNLHVSVTMIKNANYVSTDVTKIYWGGIQKSSYETILHVINPAKYPAANSPIGVYMPQGAHYVKMIRKYAEPKDVEMYADLLAKLNVKYAIENLAKQAKINALRVALDTGDIMSNEAYRQYVKNIDSVVSYIEKRLIDYSGDVAYLNNIDKIFESMKQTALQKQLKRTKSE